MGVPAAANVPGGRRLQHCLGRQHSGNLWLFGGVLATAVCRLDGPLTTCGAMTLLPISGRGWAGQIRTDQAGVYGTKGVPDAANVPGARDESISWTDSAGNVWLFGGIGYGSTTNSVAT